MDSQIVNTIISAVTETTDAVTYAEELVRPMGMTTAGWVMMLGAWSMIILLGFFCFSRIFKNKDSK
jgi:hypothetical protein